MFFDIFLSRASTFGAACSNQLLKWCIRTGGRLCCKNQKNDMADSEFSGGRQRNFAKEDNDLIFSRKWYCGRTMGATASQYSKKSTGSTRRFPLCVISDSSKLSLLFQNEGMKYIHTVSLYHRLPLLLQISDLTSKSYYSFYESG